MGACNPPPNSDPTRNSHTNSTWPAFLRILLQSYRAPLTFRKCVLWGGGVVLLAPTALRGKITSNSRNSSFARNFVRSSEQAQEGPEWARYTSTRSYPRHKKFTPAKKNPSRVNRQQCWVKCPVGCLNARTGCDGTRLLRRPHQRGMRLPPQTRALFSCI